MEAPNVTFATIYLFVRPISGQRERNETYKPVNNMPAECVGQETVALYRPYWL
jgi:hypothetical protein